MGCVEWLVIKRAGIKMKLHNPILFYLLCVFTLFCIGDIVTSFFILDGEGNPLYLIFKTIWVFVIVKLLLIFGVWYFYNRNKVDNNMSYYMFILFSVMFILLQGLAIYSNIQGIMYPEILNVASQMSTTDKLQGYFMFTGIIYLLPCMFSILSFYLYDKSLKNVKVGK